MKRLFSCVMLLSLAMGTRADGARCKCDIPPNCVVRPYYPPVTKEWAALESQTTPDLSISAIVLKGFVDFVAAHAEDTAVDWVLAEVQSAVGRGDGSYRCLLAETCELVGVDRSRHLPSLEEIYRAAQADIRRLPMRAVLYSSEADTGGHWGHVIESLVDELIAGRPVLNMLAGLADCKYLTSNAMNDNVCKSLMQVGEVAVILVDGRRDDYLRIANEDSTHDPDLQQFTRALANATANRADRNSSEAAKQAILAVNDFLSVQLANTTPSPAPAISAALGHLATGRQPTLAELSRITRTYLGADFQETGLAQILPIVAKIADQPTAESVKDVLQQVASPVGFWRVKQSHCKLTLTSFVGFMAGSEMIDEQEDSTIFGLFMPVGLDLSFPTGRNGLSTWGIYASIIDIGALATARADEDESVEPVPRGDFESVIAPGVFLRLGLGRTPITLLGGYSWPPRARNVILDDDSRYPVSAKRAIVALSVDVTLLGR